MAKSVGDGIEQFDSSSGCAEQPEAQFVEQTDRILTGKDGSKQKGKSFNFPSLVRTCLWWFTSGSRSQGDRRANTHRSHCRKILRVGNRRHGTLRDRVVRSVILMPLSTTQFLLVSGDNGLKLGNRLGSVRK